MLGLVLPPLALMAGIFFSGSDVASAPRSSSALQRLFESIAPAFAQGITPDQWEALNVAVRKMGHFTSYALLAFLVLRAVWGLRGRARGGAIVAGLIAVGFAAVDEYHQSFFPSRGASVADVLLDSVGVLAGLGVYALWARWRTRR